MQLRNERQVVDNGQRQRKPTVATSHDETWSVSRLVECLTNAKVVVVKETTMNLIEERDHHVLPFNSNHQMF